jgi:hypothetical protein
LNATAAKRGVLTVEEAGALFARPWADGAAMAANRLSATTDMRQGEVRGGDIGGGVLNAAHSWSAADGLKSPKTGEERRVSLLPEVRGLLLELLAENPHTDIPEAEQFVFWGLAPDKPRHDGVFMLSALHTEPEAMGIDWRAVTLCFTAGGIFTRRGWRTSRPPIKYRGLPGTGAGWFFKS